MAGVQSRPGQGRNPTGGLDLALDSVVQTKLIDVLNERHKGALTEGVLVEQKRAVLVS